LCLPKISPQAAIIWMSVPALAYGLAGNLFLHNRLGLSHLSVYRGLAPAVIASAFMALAAWWVRSEMLDWSTGLRLGLTILIGVIAYLGWLGLFHRQWTTERVNLLLGRS
ncbi:hypothetical protein, partial [Rhizobium leucaenae]